jgi:hypothetical protein
MSNSAAISAVTAALGKLLETGVRLADDGTDDPQLSDLEVTAQPPGKARGTKTTNQINLFLYQAVPNPSLRNRNFPRTAREGEAALPPIALNLNYLLTAYGRNDDDRLGHRILGRAMRVLNDFPLVGVSELFSSAAISDLLSESGLAFQPENIRITLIPLTLDELSKLWMMFQTDYRISAAYQVAVVLIESSRPARSALPVLNRGTGDRGALVEGSRLPILTGAGPSGPVPGAVLGSTVLISGTSLDAEGIRVRFSTIRLSGPVERDPLPGATADSLAVRIPDTGEDPGALAAWAPGIYTIALAIRSPGKPLLVTNEVPIALAPSITILPSTATAGDLDLTIACRPRLTAEQAAVLLFGDRPFRETARDTPADTALPTRLRFLVRGATPGRYLVRLRVDGVDSQPFLVSGSPPVLGFDPAQEVTIT